MKYEVNIAFSDRVLQVEAKDEDEAKEIAWQEYLDGKGDVDNEPEAYIADCQEVK